MEENYEKLEQAIADAVALALKYKHDYSVAKELNGFSILGSKYAKMHRHEHKIVFTTNVLQQQYIK
jgi:hypothetical protein